MSAFFLRKIRLILLLAVLVVVVYFLRTAYVALFETVPVASFESFKPKNSTFSAGRTASLESYSAIGKRNLLGVKNCASTQPTTSEHELFSEASAISQRGFTLLGTILGDSQASHYAVVLVNNVQSIFKVGQTVEEWKVLAIKRREVLLERNGVRERLLIDDADDAKVPERVLATDELKKELGKLDELAQNIQLSPRRMGKNSGLYVDYLRSNSFLYTLGLRRDDLLVEINGQRLMGLRNPMALMRMLEENMIALDIVRKGKRQTLMYRLVK